MEVWHDNSLLDHVSTNGTKAQDRKTLAGLQQRQCRAEIGRLLHECEVLRDKLVKKNQKSLIGI